MIPMLVAVLFKYRRYLSIYLYELSSCPIYHCIRLDFRPKRSPRKHSFQSPDRRKEKKNKFQGKAQAVPV